MCYSTFIQPNHDKPWDPISKFPHLEHFTLSLPLPNYTILSDSSLSFSCIKSPPFDLVCQSPLWAPHTRLARAEIWYIFFSNLKEPVYISLIYVTHSTALLNTV